MRHLCASKRIVHHVNRVDMRSYSFRSIQMPSSKVTITVFQRPAWFILIHPNTDIYKPVLYPWQISLRTTYDTIHGLVKISSLKFLKSLSGHHWSHQQGLPRTHASTYTLTNIYAKISSLKFFKGPSHIHQRYYIWETPMIQQCSKTQTSKLTCICLGN